MKMEIKLLVKHFLSSLRCMKWRVKYVSMLYIGHHVSIKHSGSIRFGKNVIIRPYVEIYSSTNIEIGGNTEIGERTRISVHNNCIIGRNCLISPNCYVTDCDHEYRNIVIPIKEQGINTKKAFIVFEDDCFIGINSVIIGNITIGKHAVIGANSVVTHNIPPFSVWGGSPCRELAHYDFSISKWVQTKKDSAQAY